AVYVIYFRADEFPPLENPDSGTVRGDFEFHDDPELTGWLFCNGRVQFLGPYRLKDAEFHYSTEYTHDLHGGNSGVIRIEGTAGKLETGLSIPAFALLGVPPGHAVWFVWVRVWRGRRLSHGIPMAGMIISCGFISSMMVFNGICWLPGFVAVIVILLLLLRSTIKFERILSRSQDLRLALPFTHECIVFGILSLIFFIYFFVSPNYYDYREYELSAAVSSVLFGYLGMVSGALWTSWGVAARLLLRNAVKADQEAPEP
ncbi:MAG: hypothetical protein QXW06_06640, partial [Thermoplasmata archaeon]